ncbi:MAG: hypothetical protein ACFCUS_05170 [Rubrimonas sp.]|uniref:hypothetical protein n=1 Tax=Rubrimonas sp. TaxID=2036015 RepID=UPI002FDE5A4B
MSDATHALAPEHLPFFAPAADGSDPMMVNVAIFLLLALFGGLAGILWLHTLPERLAHRSHKLQFEIVAVLGLLALFTHVHAFWVAGLLLALIDLPDISTPVRSIAGSLERIAGGHAPLDADTPPPVDANSPAPHGGSRDA